MNTGIVEIFQGFRVDIFICPDDAHGIAAIRIVACNVVHQCLGVCPAAVIVIVESVVIERAAVALGSHISSGYGTVV